ncbi:MAG: hypothetical protein RLZZ600_1032 [Actinomycetota bacterium]|jgi:hypothetical protein
MANSKDSTEQASTDATASTKATGKGQATPRRKDQEAANKRPLVPTDRKVARQEARIAQANAREKARIGIAMGDERYLPARDRGVQRRFARDYVDARYNFGELLVPFMVLVIVTSFIPGTEIASVSVMWVFVGLVFIDSMILITLLRRRMEIKFGKNSMERGVRWYAIMRGIQLRPMRMPKPQVARREYPN